MTLLQLAFTFFYIGLFTIGGGQVAITLMQQSIVSSGLISQAQFYNMVAISESTPGPIGINMATYIGRKLYGLKGAVTATVGVVLPSFIIISLAVLVLGAIGDNPWLAGAFVGVKAAVCGLILLSAIRLGKMILKTPFQWVMMICALAAVGFFNINAVWIILAAVVLGNIYTMVRGKQEPAEDPKQDASSGKEVR